MQNTNPVNQYSYPLSGRRARITEPFKAGDNPLAILHPHEARTAELFVLVERDPAVTITLPAGAVKTWSVLLSGLFRERFHIMFGFDLLPKHRKSLTENPAFRAYVTQLREQPRDAAMQQLEQDALAATTDYLDARRMAKKAEDYKVLHLQAGDHLDRIGVSKKPDMQAQQVVVVLRGRNFTETDLDKELPAIEVETVEVVE